jgi:hypothetical protein
MNDIPDDPHRVFRGRRKNGQFQKGVSGNRKGRPRRSRSTRKVMQDMLASKVPTMINGRVQYLTTIEAMAARVKREALTGPLRSLETAITIAQRYTLEDREPEHKSWDLSLLNDDELGQLHRVLAKLDGMSPEEIDLELNSIERPAEEQGDDFEQKNRGYEPPEDEEE